MIGFRFSFSTLVVFVYDPAIPIHSEVTHERKRFRITPCPSIIPDACWSRSNDPLKRGMHLAVCQMATRRYAGTIAQAVGGTSDEIYREITSNLLPNAHMVPAGIVAVSRAQEYGYTFVPAV
jgi:intracellular sulfur oxidation DsrE/DsrF family protein